MRGRPRGRALSIMPEDPDADTTFAAAQLYAAKIGFELACVSKELQKEKGGYAFNLLLRETGLFLVQLRVTTGKDDRNPPDLHVVLLRRQDSARQRQVHEGQNPRAIRPDQGGGAPRLRLSF